MDSPITPKTVLKTHLLNKLPKIIDRISPSQLGKCHRAHYYQIKHVEPLQRPGIGALANFQVGFLWEQLLKEALEAQDIQFTFQDEFLDPELNMSGSTDFIVGDPTVSAEIWDTKTMASLWFKYRKAKMKNGSYDWWEENYGYIIQQGCYLLLAEKKGYKISKAVLAFITKDDGYIGEELAVFLTDKLRREVMDRIKELNSYLDADEVPPCTCEGWLVGYCSYSNPNTMQPNKKKKMIGTECCPGSLEEIEAWRTESIALHA